MGFFFVLFLWEFFWEFWDFFLGILAIFENSGGLMGVWGFFSGNSGVFIGILGGFNLNCVIFWGNL